MKKLEVFFDYACPYCYKGHEILKELSQKYPEVEIVFRPCEAHPRPEQAAVHSDLAIQGMYFVKANRGDLWKYHELMYGIVFEKELDLSDPEVLAGCARECGVSASEFRQALRENRYAEQVVDGNLYAWDEKGLEAVPSYAAGAKILGSHSGAAVTGEELDAFLAHL